MVKKSWKTLVTEAVFGKAKEEKYNTFDLFEYNGDYYMRFDKVPLDVKTFGELANVEGSGVYLFNGNVYAFNQKVADPDTEDHVTPETEIVFDKGVATYITLS